MTIVRTTGPTALEIKTLQQKLERRYHEFQTHIRETEVLFDEILQLFACLQKNILPLVMHLPTTSVFVQDATQEYLTFRNTARGTLEDIGALQDHVRKTIGWTTGVVTEAQEVIRQQHYQDMQVYYKALKTKQYALQAYKQGLEWKMITLSNALVSLEEDLPLTSQDITRKQRQDIAIVLHQADELASMLAEHKIIW